MSKYDPLSDYLRQQTASELTLSFPEIERVIGGPLPLSAMRPQWWANETSRSTAHVQCLAWRAAGYDAFLYAGRKVKFRKADGAGRTASGMR